MKAILKNSNKIYAAVIITALILSAVGWIIISFFNNTEYVSPVALIYQNGKLTYTIELSKGDKLYDILLSGESGEKNTVRIQGGEIGIIDASCPDMICVKTGFIKNGFVPIICLPNKIEIRITESNGGGLDAVVR